MPAPTHAPSALARAAVVSVKYVRVSVFDRAWWMCVGPHCTQSLNILRTEEAGVVVVKLADLGVGRVMSAHTVMLQVGSVSRVCGLEGAWGHGGWRT